MSAPLQPTAAAPEFVVFCGNTLADLYRAEVELDGAIARAAALHYGLAAYLAQRGNDHDELVMADETSAVLQRLDGVLRAVRAVRHRLSKGTSCAGGAA